MLIDARLSCRPFPEPFRGLPFPPLLPAVGESFDDEATAAAAAAAASFSTASG